MQKTIRFDRINVEGFEYREFENENLVVFTVVSNETAFRRMTKLVKEGYRETGLFGMRNYIYKKG